MEIASLDVIPPKFQTQNMKKNGKAVSPVPIWTPLPGPKQPFLELV
jgi:hypothetical protein